MTRLHCEVILAGSVPDGTNELECLVVVLASNPDEPIHTRVLPETLSLAQFRAGLVVSVCWHCVAKKSPRRWEVKLSPLIVFIKHGSGPSKWLQSSRHWWF